MWKPTYWRSGWSFALQPADLGLIALLKNLKMEFIDHMFGALLQNNEGGEI